MLPNQMLLYVRKLWIMVTPSGTVSEFWNAVETSKKNLGDFVYNFLKRISRRPVI